MQFVWEWNVGTLILIGGHILGSVWALSKLHSKAETADEGRKKVAREFEDYKEANQQQRDAYRRDIDSHFSTLHAAVALIREEYAHKQELRDLKADLKEEFRELNRRLDGYFRQVDKT